ncbi:hypothetical protein NBRC116493_16980 [Aurantivibrio infirmus]
MRNDKFIRRENRSLPLRWRISFSLLFVLFSHFSWSQCTNCTSSTVGGNTIHVFTSGSGTFTPPSSVNSVDYLIVAGGGGGGAGESTSFFSVFNHGGGGGGAGGMLSGVFSVSATTYNVTVGAGGAGGINTTGGDGGNSTFDGFVANGGGGGGAYAVNGRPGGSGGGGGGQRAGGAGSQGNAGGDGHNTFFDNRGGGGGGGAGNAGGDGSDDIGGTGGAGNASSISGSSLTYARGGDGGGPGLPGNNGVAGTANTGSGGGGGWSSAGDGADGGAGIVIISYPTPVVVPLAIAEYRMDEASWNGTAGEVIDSAGSGLHGTAVGGSTTASALSAVTGSPGTCRYGVFDGLDDYLNVGNISDTLNATASLAFWIRTTQTGNNTGWLAPGITGVEQSGGSDDIFWGWLDASGHIGLSVGNSYSTKSSTVINDDVWHHIVLTRDHMLGTYKIYVDGNLDASGAIAAGVIGNTYSSIGRIEDTGGSPEYFSGQLDEVRVYDSVLTDADVLVVMGDTHLCSAALCPGQTPQGGLIGDYYNGVNLSGGVINSRVDGPINFNWGGGSPGVSGIGNDQFSVQWNGYIRATETGQYFFRTLSDDGVRLTVDGVAVISNWTDHAVTTNTSGAVTLTAGQIYPVVLEFYERGGQAEIRLQWQTPSSGSFVPIPAGPAVLDAGLYSCVNNNVGYYEISHSGTGLTCEAEAITISAFNGSGTPMNPPNGTTIVFDTTPNSGTWAGSNSFTFDGSVATTTQYLRQTTPATLNINVSDGSASEIASADPDLTYTDVGIRFYGDTSASPVPNQIAGIADADTVLRVVEASSDTGACVARVQNTNRDVELGYECRNPAACSSGQTLSLNGTSIQSNNNGASINYSTVNLSFDANGFAAIPFQYSDVGAVRLHSQLDLPVEGNDAAITITGSSSEFVVKPDSLVIINVQDSGGSPNPATQGGGVGFIPAGSSFEVRLEARNALGARTPAFGRESSPENIQTTIANLTFPGGGNIGILANANAFVPDVATPGVYENNSLSWNEVGSFTLSPSLTDGNYLGAGTVTSVESNTVGRFYPADFSLASGSVGDSCSVGGFSYLSDPSVTVEYQIHARNISGAVVNNYDNTDLSYPAASVSYHAENNNNGDDLGSRLSAAMASWDDGVVMVSDTASVFNRALAGPNVIVDGPFTSVVVGVALNDIDAANFSDLDFKPGDSNNCVVDADCDSKLLSGLLNLRFGRLHVKDGHGPESAAIPMNWQTEYWDGSRFVLNSDDQCTQLPLANINFVGATNTVDAINDRVTVDLGGITSVFNFSDPLGGDSCLSTTAIGFCDGRAGIEYGASGSIVAYPIDIDLSALDFLQGDWNQDGSYNDPLHPVVTIRFEHYRGHDRVIFWREVLQ